MSAWPFLRGPKKTDHSQAWRGKDEARCFDVFGQTTPAARPPVASSSGVCFRGTKPRPVRIMLRLWRNRVWHSGGQCLTEQRRGGKQSNTTLFDGIPGFRLLIQNLPDKLKLEIWLHSPQLPIWSTRHAVCGFSRRSPEALSAHNGQGKLGSARQARRRASTTLQPDRD
jgi:hypothetical protein